MSGKKLGRKFLGFEIVQERVDEASRRLSGEVTR